MEKIVFAVILGVMFCAASAFADERFFTQPLDHFNESSQTLQQRVQIFKPDGVSNDAPVVFFLGGEGRPIDVADMAKPFADFMKMHPMIFIQAEHRGYGMSLSNDEDQTVPTYVTTDQAIEDFHNVIQTLRSEFTGPWILAGYSYSGGLAIRLAHKYPQAGNAVYSSSGALSWPLIYTDYDKGMRNDWPPGLYAKLAKIIAALNPQTAFSDKWKNRELVQWGLMGIAQYKANQKFLPYVKSIAHFSPEIFVSVFRWIDTTFAKGKASEWAAGRAKLKLSLTEAKTQKFYSRYYGYQQCYELGLFIKSDGTQKVFPQSESEWRDYCQTMYGISPDFKKAQDWTWMASDLTVPLFYIVGKNDPWLATQLTPEASFKSGGHYFLAKDGFHCPDREDPSLTTEAMGKVFKALGY